MEWQEQHPIFRCDDGTMDLEKDPLVGFYSLAHEAFSKIGFDPLLAANLKKPLEEAGFINIQCIVKKVPVGTWARDKRLRLLGKYQKTIIREIIPVVCGRPLQALGLSDAEREAPKKFAKLAPKDGPGRKDARADAVVEAGRGAGGGTDGEMADAGGTG